MAGFLRKFRKNVDVEHPAPSKPVQFDSPPSLPPLFARFATSTLESSLLESCIMPVPKSQPEDEWDPWKALVPESQNKLPTPEPPPPPPPPPPQPRVQPPLLPPTRRKYTGPGLPPQVKVAGMCFQLIISSCFHPCLIDPDAHQIRAVSTRQDRNDHLSPMVSQHPSKITSHPPQAPKPGSSSSSSSNHTDATRFTHSGSSSSAFTSTSSIAPAIKVSFLFCL
jgi:hypothetical protein